jgi:hypothetical protein
MSLIKTSISIENNTQRGDLVTDTGKLRTISYTSTPSTTGTLLSVPSPTSSIIVKLWGGAGSGGGFANNFGGGGGFTEFTFAPQVGYSYYISVGRPGRYRSTTAGTILRGGNAYSPGISGCGGDASCLIQFYNNTYTLMAVAGGGGGAGGTIGTGDGFGGAGGGSGGQNGVGDNLNGLPAGGTNGMGGYGYQGTGQNCTLTSATITGFGGAGANATGSPAVSSGGGGGYGGGGTSNGAGGGGGGGLFNTEITGYISGSTTVGFGRTPANTSDAYYANNAGLGGVSYDNGNAGLIVVIYMVDYYVLYGQSLGVGTVFDRQTATSGTAPLVVANHISRPTITAKNANVTTNTAATLYIENAPLAGTNQTFINSYSLQINSGVAYFGGGITSPKLLVYKAGSTTASTSGLYISPSATAFNGINNYYFTYLSQPLTSGTTTGAASSLYIADAPLTTSITPQSSSNRPGYVTFIRKNSTFMSAPATTFNISTNGGFTAMVYVRMIENIANYERILDFGNGSPNNNIVICRDSVTANINGVILNPDNSNYAQVISGTMVQGVWTLITMRYIYSSNILQLYQDGTLLGTSSPPTQFTNRTLNNNYIGQSNWAGDQYTSMNLAGIVVYDRDLSDAEITTCTNILKGQAPTNTVPATPKYKLFSSDITTFANFGRVSTWDVFTQSTSGNQPYYVPIQTPTNSISAVIGNTGNTGTAKNTLAYIVPNYVSFSATNSQFMAGPQSIFPVNTGGGFTAVAYVRFTGAVAGSYERIFDFGNGPSINSITLYRNSTSTNIGFTVCPTTVAYAAISGSGGTQTSIVQNVWTLIVCRYTVSGGAMQLYQDGILCATATVIGSPYGNPTIYNYYLGRSNQSADAYANIDYGGLIVYTRVLTDAEIVTCSNIVRGATDRSLLPATPFTTLLSSEIASVNNKKIISWGIFSQSTLTNCPTFYVYPQVVGSGNVTFSNTNTTQVIGYNPRTRRWLAGSDDAYNSLAFSEDGVYWNGLGTSIMGNVVGMATNKNVWVIVGNYLNAVAISIDDGITWTGVAVGQLSFSWDVTWNPNSSANGRWIAVGTLNGVGTICYSDNEGVTWTSVQNVSGISNYFYAVCTAIKSDGSRVWVSGCDGGLGNSLAYSLDDGISWVPTSTHLFSSWCYSVKYNGSYWVAVGSGSANSVATSPDGINWTGRGKPISVVRDVTWTGSYWVIIGEPSGAEEILAYSLDAITWTLVTGTKDPLTKGSCISSMYYPIINQANSLYVAADSSYFGGDVSIGGSLSAASAQKTFVINQRVFNQTYKRYTIPHDKTTYIKSSNITAYIKGIPNNQQVYTFGRSSAPLSLSVGATTNTLAYSTDSLRWNGLGATIFTTRGYRVAWNSFMWIAVGEGTNSIAYSFNGINWTGLGLSYLSIGRDVIWDGTKWLAVGLAVAGMGNNPIVYSYNGIVWLPTTSSGIFSSNTVYCIAYNGYMYLAGGNSSNSMAYSYDGFNWVGISGTPNIFTNYCHGIAWNGNMWLAAGLGTNVLAWCTNPDPTNYANWTKITTGTSGTFSTSVFTICWTGSLWIASGSGGNDISYSYNGNNWIALNSGIFTSGLNVVWDGTKLIAHGSGANTQAWSVTGMSWIGLGTGTYNNDGRSYATTLTLNNSITFPRNISVAAGGTTGTTLLYSTDGITWTNSSSGSAIFTSNAYCLAWNGSIWLAGGNGSKLAVSRDGTNWTQLNTNIMTTYYGLAWNGTMWIVVGAGTNTLAYSYDGYTWTGLGVVLYSQGYSIAWSGSMWIAGGSPGTERNIIYSYNGFDWYPISNPSVLGNSSYFSIVHNGTLWVACGDNSASNSIVYSYDGYIWYKVANCADIFSLYARGIAWNGSLWVAVGGSSDNTKSTAWSLDGINWTNGTNIFSSGGYAVTWNGSLWIATGQSTNALAYSKNGKDWVSASGANFANNGNVVSGTYASNTRLMGKGFVYIQHPMIAMGEGTNTIAYSEDGLLWRGLGTQIFTTYGFSATWNGSIWVACGAGSNALAWSQDGITWTGLGTSIFSESRDVAWNGSIWVAVGLGTFRIAWSLDGKTWTGVSTANGGSLLSTSGYSVAWNGSTWAAVGVGSTDFVISSTDGKVWYGQGTGSFTTGIYKIIWIGVRWIVAGEGGSFTIRYSTDLSTWSDPASNIFTTAAMGLAWNGTRIVAVGSGTNTIAYSNNSGDSWTAVVNNSSIFSTSGRAVAWNGRAFITGGYGTSSLAYSGDGVNWVSVPNSTTLFSTGCRGIGTNSRIGAVVVDSQLVLNNLGYGLDNALDVISDSYYDSGITNFSVAINYT